uniref:Uncharacterized protein n=1 Tax=Cacopsylla melanoneura TaxID=428564 RepID=A0A8D8VKI7_9HEMI
MADLLSLGNFIGCMEHLLSLGNFIGCMEHLLSLGNWLNTYKILFIEFTYVQFETDVKPNKTNQLTYSKKLIEFLYIIPRSQNSILIMSWHIFQGMPPNTLSLLVESDAPVHSRNFQHRLLIIWCRLSWFYCNRSRVISP